MLGGLRSILENYLFCFLTSFSFFSLFFFFFFFFLIFILVVSLVKRIPDPHITVNQNVLRALLSKLLIITYSSEITDKNGTYGVWNNKDVFFRFLHSHACGRLGLFEETRYLYLVTVHTRSSVGQHGDLSNGLFLVQLFTGSIFKSI